MKVVRGALIAVGGIGLLVGAWLLATTVRPSGLVGLAVWLGAAVVLHDAILSPVLFVAGWVLRHGGRRLPLAALAVVQVAALVGAICTLMLLPAIRAKQIGVRNASVLPFDYVGTLVGMWIALAVLTAAGIVIVLAVQRARSRGTSAAVAQ